MRLLPIGHLAGTTGEEGVPTASALRTLFVHTVRTQLDSTQRAVQHRARTPGTLQVPDRTHENARLARPTRPHAVPLRGSALVDAARLLGELFRLHIIINQDAVASWLETLLLAPRAWVHVPLHELEAACALLLLVGPEWQASHLLDGASFRACSLTTTIQASRQEHRSRTLLTRCVHRLEDLVHSTLVPDVTKEWVYVRNSAIFDRRASCMPRIASGREVKKKCVRKLWTSLHTSR